VFFGFLRANKGLECLIDAALKAHRTLQELVVLIIGGLHQRMPGVAESIKDNLPNFVIFTGYLPEEELDIYFSAADAFCFPYDDSVAGASGAAYRVLGYLKPMIVTDIPKFYEFKKAKIGVIVPKDDPDTLARAIIATLRNPSKRDYSRLLKFYESRTGYRMLLPLLRSIKGDFDG